MWIIAVHSCIISGIIFLWYHKTRSSRLACWFLPALSLKIACGWLIGGLYLYYYSGGDTWNYFTDGVALAEFARTTSFSNIFSGENTDITDELIYANQPRALLMSRIVGVGCLLTLNNYWLISTYFSLLSFGGVWFLVQTFNKFFPRTQYAVGIAWLAYPTFVFWSSGILKETIAVGLISVLAALTVRFYYRSVDQIALFVLSWLLTAVLLWLLKYYYAAVLVPLSLAIILARLIPHSRFSIVAKTMLLFILLTFAATLLHPNLKVDRILNVIVQNHDTFIHISRADAVISFHHLKPTLTSFLRNSPLAVFSAWYRPLLFDMNTSLAQIAGLENCLLFVLSMVTLWKVKKTGISEGDERLWIVVILLYSVLLGGLLAISTPNFGTLIRYKAAFSPFLLYLVLCPLLLRKSYSLPN